MELRLTNDFMKIVLDETPLIDVRAPIEFIKGSFKNSVNLPILSDKERELVGTTYKQEGSEQAMSLGYELVSGEVKQARIESWKKELDASPDALIYCFRGGSRSRITQEWLKEECGIDRPRLEGGYKAFRNFLIDAMTTDYLKIKPIILGGYTGSGKTIMLKPFKNFIDLEKIANHRGSSFGKHVSPQPTTINFENNLAYELIQKQENGYKHMLLEDEGRHVGTCYLPKELHEYINTGSLVIVDVPLEKRIEITLDEYVRAAQEEYIKDRGSDEEGYKAWYEYIYSSMARLKQKLGDEKLRSLLKMLEDAFTMQMKTDDVSLHRSWIGLFLKDYYDAMYQYQIDNNVKDIIFRGNEKEVSEFLSSMEN